jgi:hypothetical protein
VRFVARATRLSLIRLLSDRQPEKLRVDNYTEWWPHVRLHADPPNMAWIFLNVPSQDCAGSPVNLDTSSATCSAKLGSLR